MPPKHLEVLREAIPQVTQNTIKPALVLVHSPIVGPRYWSRARDELRTRDVRCITPDLDGDESRSEPFWKQHVEAAASAIHRWGVRTNVVLVGHSGAGMLLPAIGRELEIAPAGYLFVDAGLPAAGASRIAAGAFAAHLRELHLAGRRFPDWTSQTLAAVVPDSDARQMLLSELRPQPPSFWTEVIDVPREWPNAPCGYLRFTPNPSYDAAAAGALSRSWPFRQLHGGHFHMVVDPVSVAEAVLSLAQDVTARA